MIVRRSTAQFASVVALYVLLLAGCGSELSQVSGRVTFDGEPVDRATVVFQGPGLPQAVDTTRADGIYSLSTGGKQGLPPGAYRVTISAYQTRRSENELSEPVPVLRTPAKYNKPETSGLTAEVQPGHNEFDFQLRSNGG